MLPHAAHAREVVLELRELDLELSLGAPRVLREDVEDQLRAVDDARAERVLERPLLRRAELVVGEEHLGVDARRTASSARRASPCRRTSAGPGARGAGRARRRARRLRCARAPGAPRARRPRRALRIHADEERALRLRPGCGIGLARSHCEDYAAVRSGGDRARRPPRRADARARGHPVAERHEDAIRERLLELVPEGSDAEFAGDEAFLFAPRRAAPGRRRSCSPRTTTPCPRRTTFPGGSPTARCTGSARAT